MTFAAAPFSLELVRQISVAALRVEFTQYPRALNAGNVDDALNPNNYTLAGPGSNYVIGCATVDGDRQSVDLYLAAPLDIGEWHLAVDNVVEDASETLIPPTNLPFQVSFTLTSDPLGHGAVNEEYENIIRKFLNPALKGRGWDSIIAALASADQRNADNARLAFDQLFLSSANGLYLDRRASDEGINRPAGVNMSDNLFRKLALAQKNGKLTQKAILDVLEIFYGRDATRASSDTKGPEFYPLQDGDQLVILFEERNTVTVTFERSHFSRIGAATAVEVAAAITRACRDAGNAGFAVSFKDTITGLNRVRIYSGTLGLTSSIRVIGGRGNTVLLFPTPLFSQSGVSPFATWNIAQSPDTQGNLRFTMTAGTEYNLFLVHDGDLVYIYGDEFADSANGTYEIKAMSVTISDKWFEIENPLGAEASAVDQTRFTDLMFFRPKRKTIYDSARRVIVCENDGFLDIIMPATTEVVDRGPGLAAYLHGADAQPISGGLVRNGNSAVNIDAGGSHGLQVGDQIFVDGVLPTGDVPGTDPGSPSTDFPSANSTVGGSTDSSIHSASSQAGSYQGVWSKAVRDPSGRLMVVGGATTADSVTYVPLNRITVLEFTGDSFVIGGGRSVAYDWTQIASTDGSHGFHGNHFGYRNFGASLLLDGRVFCTGGSIGDDAAGTAQNGYDLFTFLPPLAVSQQNGTMLSARAAHGQCSLLGEGDALISGGWTVNNTPLNTAAVWFEGTETWSAVTSMNVARMHHELVTLDSGGLVLAVGGQKDAAATQLLNRCELYDTGGDAWRFTGNMTYARVRFGVVKIPDGRVIVLGGRGYKPSDTNTPSVLKTCEIYDPKTNLWSSLPPMLVAREYPVCAYMPNTNDIWVTSGDGTSVTTEVLNLATMKWKVAAQAPAQATHIHATGGRLSDDVFALIGGTLGTATEKVNSIVVPGDDKFWLGAGLNGIHRVDDVPDGTHFTVHTNTYNHRGGYTTSRTSATFTPMRAEPAPSTVPGPFSYDVKSGFAITATAGVTDTSFNKGVHYSSLHLTGFDPALTFPDREGWLVFNFGYKNVVGPIRYLGRLSDEDLILDAAAPFSETIPAGATVRLLNGRVPFEPRSDHLVGNFYVTGTAAGREAARNVIDDITAAGKQVLVTVLYPGDHGLGAAGFPQGGYYKLSDKVSVWGGDELDTEIPAAQKGP